MGIQRFGAHLKAYATKGVLGSTETPAQNTTAVIDGPGLAHYVYYKLCGKRDGSTENITYSDIADETITWLDILASIGYQVKAVLFDGALPESKKNVRIGRLQSYIDRLRVYKQSVGSGLPTRSGQTRKTLPPPPFLVFAVVEELLRHDKYAGVTYVVPGEADGFCVAAARSLSEQFPNDGIAIFSDDADLLVYAVPAKTCVIPLRDLSESRAGNEIIWSGDLYWSAEIVKRLPDGLRDLIKPAFYMAQDPHCDLKQACREAVGSDPALRPEFSAFAKTFQPTDEVVEWEKITGDVLVKELLAARDSRVSELICQLQSSDSLGGLRMYLPFLLEDIARASAWNVGADIRTMAYSALLRAFSSDASIQEYRRSGARAVSTPIDGLEGAALNEQLDKLAAHIGKVRSWAAEDSQLSADDAWRYLAMQHTLQYLHLEGYRQPSLADVVLVVTGRSDRKWHLLHLSAQYQAMYYSLRLLRQVLAHVLSMAAGKSEAGPTKRLYDRLAPLPQIAAFLADDRLGNTCQAEVLWRERFGEVLAGFSGEGQSQRQGKKRKKKSKKVRADAPVEPSLATNAFAVLADG